ncbi:reverse transcriptase domain-containing protein [Tanacetum coccineum]
MAKKNEEKMAFHTDEGIFCYTKMPFKLKNARATYQRLVDTIFKGQMGRNLEAYVDDMVITRKTELEMIKDVEETLMTLKKVNMKLNPKKGSFRIEEGKFLVYIVTSKGIRVNPQKTKAVMNMPSPSNLKQMQWLSDKLAALNRFLSKAVERALPCLDTLKKSTNKKDFHWTTEAEEALPLDYRGAEERSGNESTDTPYLLDGYGVLVFRITLFDVIRYTKDSGFELTRFSDADYAGCKDTFKSTSGGA